MLSDAANLRPTMSSLPLEIMLFFNWHFSVIFFILNLCLYTYKSLRYYYPGSILGWDFTTVFAYAIVESSSKGNKTSQVGPLIVGLLLSLPIVVLHAYYLELQIYVLRIDTALNSIALVFLGVEFILALFVTFSFISASRRF